MLLPGVALPPDPPNTAVSSAVLTWVGSEAVPVM